jgi:hypothetical protein
MYQLSLILFWSHAQNNLYDLMGDGCWMLVLGADYGYGYVMVMMRWI